MVRALTDFGALSNHELPPYYEIMNFVLITSALDDWDDAEMFRLSAEETCRETLEDATYTNDEASRETLKKLREELDALERFKDEDMLELYGVDCGSPDDFGETEHSGKPFWDDSDFDDDDEDNSKILGDAQAFDTKELELPVRPGVLRKPTQAAEVAKTTGTDAAPPSFLAPPIVTTGSLRRHNSTSKVSKGGA
ncbi:hypothetical protein N0V86_009493 [Didymella sp. IMI 355093]|nr:hypothetical protein N0V86_009493 [Didymella sp. IMI 355093]